MVSRPLGNLTYSEWMSARWRAVEGGGGRWRLGKANSTPASTATPPPTCTAFHRLAPLSTALVPIAHPPDPIAGVVAHYHRPSLRTFRCSGGTLSPRLSRSLLLPKARRWSGETRDPPSCGAGEDHRSKQGESLHSV